MRIFILSLFAALLSTSALAGGNNSDAVNWTGPYAGVTLGAGFGNGTMKLGYNDVASAGIGAAIAGGAIPTKYSTDPGGILGGMQAGYNYQIMPKWVLGTEVDFSGSDIRGAQAINTTAGGGFFPLNSSAGEDLDSLGTLRARVGYTENNWLFYGTGGGAYGHTTYHYYQSNVNGGGAVNFAQSDSANEFGYAAGAGIEYAWTPKTTVRFEYLFVDLGDHSYNAHVNTAPASYFIPNFEDRFNILRVAVNYKF